MGMRPRVVEHGLQCVERARADVAEHHPERRNAGDAESSDRLRLGAGGLDRHFVLHSTIGRGVAGMSLVRGPKRIGDAFGLRFGNIRRWIAGETYPPSTLTNFACRARPHR